MSVFKLKGSPYYHFDFQFRGSRFHGSTKCKGRREAEAFERVERERAKKSTQARSSNTSLKLDDVAERYWEEVGKHSANPADVWRDLERLVDYLTPAKMLDEISDNDVAELVAWRRGHRVIRGKKRKLEECPLISNATVNRSTTELLKRMFNRNRKASLFPIEPDWSKHLLSEPDERVRELNDDEVKQIEDATRDDYAPFFEFASAAGLRLDECLLKWSEVNWSAKRILKTGKKDKIISAPITERVRQILWPLRGQHKEMVFTYVARRTANGKVKGERYPITYSGVKTMWRRMRKKSGVVDFRFHDFRHDLATKLLRETGNLKLVQRALNHADIRTTMRYAHVLDAEVAAALDSVAESRNKSQSKARKAG